MCCSSCVSAFFSLWVFFGFFAFMKSYNLAVAEGVMSLKATGPMWTFVTCTIINFIASFMFSGVALLVVVILTQAICILVSIRLKKALSESKKLTQNVNNCIKWCTIFTVVYVVQLAAAFVTFFVTYMGLSFK